MIGQAFGSYRVVRQLGEGGMGVVWAAEHHLLGSQAVVKQLHPELSGKRELVERFFNEARAATRIKHSGIVSVFDFGYTQDGTAYLVMEFLEGESLGQQLQRLGRLPEEKIVRLTRQVASALAAAHEVGIVHRDLKPDNIFLVPDEAVPGGERIKVLDFGIAKLSSDAGGVAVTRTGALLGSPMYMSPEQCRGSGDVDLRCDIYALGCVMFAMACGRPPFLGDGLGEVLGKHMYEAPRSPRDLVPSLSPGLEAAILRALAKRPEDRFRTMRELSAALNQVNHAGAGPAYANVPVPVAPSPTSGKARPHTAPTRGEDHRYAPTRVAGAPDDPPGPGTQQVTGPRGRRRAVALWTAAVLATGGAGVVAVRSLSGGHGRGGSASSTNSGASAGMARHQDAGTGQTGAAGTGQTGAADAVETAKAGLGSAHESIASASGHEETAPPDAPVSDGAPSAKAPPPSAPVSGAQSATTSPATKATLAARAPGDHPERTSSHRPKHHAASQNHSVAARAHPAGTQPTGPAHQTTKRQWGQTVDPLDE